MKSNRSAFCMLTCTTRKSCTDERAPSLMYPNACLHDNKSVLAAQWVQMFNLAVRKDSKQAMGMELVPYGFSSPSLPRQSTPILPGQVCVVTFTLSTETEWIIERLRLWFANRDEVSLVANGETFGGLSFITLEWEECEADQLLLDILRHEEAVDDVMVYIRELEG